MEKEFVKNIADINGDFSQWYTDIVLKTQLCDYGPVKGTMVIRPYGYAVWELIQSALDKEIKATGHKNAYFPLFIPESFLKKEAEHVEGFAPECAMVTHVGAEKLAEPFVVRPTSETVICDMYAKWIQSYKDLPVLLNQWCNVVRMEKTTRPFLRTSEFLWQEGHTVHATAEEAEAETIKMLKVYERVLADVLAIPALIGRKSDSEKFAGAVATYSLEAMMRDGKSLQAGTSHYLGDNFSKAFNIKFLDSDGVHKYGQQTSWGVTTRLIGAIIMVHGDERGLALPPLTAPIQAVIVPIASGAAGVSEKSESIFNALKKNFRVHLDTRDNKPGFKFNDWEMKGVPVRIEIGPRDLEAGVVTVMRRDTLQKTAVPIEKLKNCVSKLLKDMQKNMYKKALARLNANIVPVKNMDELEAAVNGGKFGLAMWCGEKACEKAVKERMQATSRNMPFNQTPLGCGCVCCGKAAAKKIYFGRAY